MGEIHLPDDGPSLTMAAFDDPRPLINLVYPDGEHRWTLGQGQVTKITAYPEPGLHSDMSFYAVWSGETIMARVPATLVTAVYGLEVCDG